MSSSGVVVGSWGAEVPAGLLGVGRTLAAALGAPFTWVVVGTPPAEAEAVAARQGIHTLTCLGDPRLVGFGSDLYVAGLAGYARERPFRVLLLAQSFDARVLAPRLAARLDAGVVMNGLAVDVAGESLVVTASAYGGDTRVVYELAGAERWVIGMATAALDTTDATSPSTPIVETLTPDLAAVTERVRVLQRSEATGPRIEDADIIVAGGRGLGAKENYRLVEELAAALGGMAGASRPIVDDGWAEPSRQVGLTGKVTRPSLYIAAGISGASQHMVGCAAAKTLVAINRDPEAAIFRYARYGLVGDCLEILPALIRAVKG